MGERIITIVHGFSEASPHPEDTSWCGLPLATVLVQPGAAWANWEWDQAADHLQCAGCKAKRPSQAEEHRLTIEGYCHACRCFPDFCGPITSHQDEWGRHVHHEDMDADD